MSECDNVKEWQIEIRKKNNDPHEIDELIVYVCPEHECDNGELVQNVKNQIMVDAEITPNDVVILGFDEIVKRLELETASKEKRIVDMRVED